MVKVTNICDALGRRNVATRCAVGLTAVSNWCAEDKIPAKFYLVIKDMCGEIESPCPDCMFSFSHPAEGDE